MNKNETRFSGRKTFSIDLNSFTEVMQEIRNDSTLVIDENYPTLSMYSELNDWYFGEEEIIGIIGDYLNENIITCIKRVHLNRIYFVCETEIIEAIDLKLHLPGVGKFEVSRKDLEQGIEKISRLE